MHSSIVSLIYVLLFLTALEVLMKFLAFCNIGISADSEKLAASTMSTQSC
jgi:hypothetical protein